MDVVESVNILVNSNGQIIRSDVVGALKMRTYLRYLNSLILIRQSFVIVSKVVWMVDHGYILKKQLLFLKLYFIL